MTTLAPVSCYIRTFNEERKIGEVVAAVRDVVDEIVLVDNGSTDATVAIAKSHGARVIHQEWLGRGRQKRFAEEQCRNDYLLDLDADEVVSPELGAEIRALFANGPPAFPVYELKLVIVPPVGKPWWNVAVAHRRKLYDRRVVRQPDHLAWDQFELPEGVAVGRLSGAVMHYSFRDLEHMMQKLNIVSSIRAKETRRHRGRWEVGSRVLFAFPVYFLKHYALRGYYRLGVYGVATAAILAYGRWLRDAKMYERLLAERAAPPKGKERVMAPSRELNPQ
ncbi:MAG TPA: glycosyltransferase family 2 protein [Hyphomicrobiaceae bacterium]|jgi:glycosyltransferase involved in cell wall biosynthesis|nr:glycosyltransferase family 2 protein [Hyphomicrobiaceae bacterium]